MKEKFKKHVIRYVICLVIICSTFFIMFSSKPYITVKYKDDSAEQKPTQCYEIYLATGKIKYKEDINKDESKVIGKLSIKEIRELKNYILRKKTYYHRDYHDVTINITGYDLSEENLKYVVDYINQNINN